MRPRPRSLAGVLSGAVILMLVGAGLLLAATGPISAGHDATIDPNNPDTTHNNQLLEVTYSNFPEFVPTRRALLRFSLEEVTSIPTDGGLTVDVVLNTLPADATVDVALYSIDDNWDENAVTWANAPEPISLLQTSPVATGYTGPVMFTSSPVRDYMAAELAGDGMVSFMLVLNGGAGNLGFAGNLLFEDHEGTHDGVNGNEPRLLVEFFDTPATSTPTRTPTSTPTTTPTLVPTSTPVLPPPATPTPNPDHDEELFIPYVVR